MLRNNIKRYRYTETHIERHKTEGERYSKGNRLKKSETETETGRKTETCGRKGETDRQLHGLTCQPTH